MDSNTYSSFYYISLCLLKNALTRIMSDSQSISDSPHFQECWKLLEESIEYHRGLYAPKTPQFEQKLSLTISEEGHPTQVQDLLQKVAGVETLTIPTPQVVETLTVPTPQVVDVPTPQVVETLTVPTPEVVNVPTVPTPEVVDVPTVQTPQVVDTSVIDSGVTLLENQFRPATVVTPDLRQPTVAVNQAPPDQGFIGVPIPNIPQVQGYSMLNVEGNLSDGELSDSDSSSDESWDSSDEE